VGRDWVCFMCRSSLATWQGGEAVKKFPSKNKMHQIGVLNSYDIAELGRGKVFISWSPQMLDRGYEPAKYQVIHIGYHTNPKAPWYDYGHQTFNLFQYERDRDKTARAAMAWADKKMGKREWVRDPFGSYQDARALEAVIEKMKKAGGEQ